MGIIQRQSIKNSFVNYVAVAIGFVNLFVYTATLTKEEIGFYQFCLNTALLVMPFILLGSNNLSLKYFPLFNDSKNKNNGFLFLVLAYPLFGFVFFLLIVLFFQNQIIDSFAKHGQYTDYFHYIIYLVFILSLNSVFTTYSSNFKRIVVPAIFNNLFIKIAIPLLAILYYYEYFSFQTFLQGIVIAYAIALVLLIAYIKWLGELSFKSNFKLLNRPLLKEMIQYQAYCILVGVGNTLAIRIDLFMITYILGWGYGGVYTIVMIISQVITVPSQAISSIIRPVVAEASAKNDLVHLKELYQKSAINQLIAGMYIFIGIWLSIDDLLMVIPNGQDYQSGKIVILILGIAKLIDMGSGINGHIITFSKYYSFNLYAILVLAVLNIINNIVFIPLYQLNGAAFATLLSLSIFNLLRMIYIHLKFKMQPFTIDTVKAILIGLFSYYIITLVPSVENLFLNMLIKSVLVTILYWTLIYSFKVSEDINGIIKNGIDLMNKKK